MLKLSFKDRISLYNLFGVSILILIIFSSIYITVLITINYDIDKELKRELSIHREKSAKINGTITLVHKDEWQQSEHNTLDMNPIFIQIFNDKGESVDKSPNLGSGNLKLYSDNDDEKISNSKVNFVPIRQIQIKLQEDGQKFGYTVIAMSVNPQYRVLRSLIYILFITYVLFLLILFFLTRLIAGRSIRPALLIMETMKNITVSNLEARITLPSHRDELYTLSENINELLNRIESAVRREKQFTTDASHELRTPLAIIQTTLELLIKRPRTTEEYVEKINSCIEEVTRIERLVSQLLMLARFEQFDQKFKLHTVELTKVIDNAIMRNHDQIKLKNLTIDFSTKSKFHVLSHESMLSIIIINLISNAIKYSHDNQVICIELSDGFNDVNCNITDYGVGILSQDLEKVYDQFYRSEANENGQIKGSGLGLSIVKKLTLLLGINIYIHSSKRVGTSIYLKIPKE